MRRATSLELTVSEYVGAAIRQVQDMDYERLSRFLEENNRPEITRTFHPFPLTSETAYQITSTSHLDRYYIAIWDGRVVGLCMLRGWDEGFQIPSFGVLVDHRFHRCGLGRWVTEFAIEEARKLNCHSIRLSVYASDTRAMHLYASLGFREISRESIVAESQQDMKIVMIKRLE